MLVANWRRVLKHAWSIRLMILAFLLSAAEVALPLIDGVFDIPQGVFALASGAATGGAFVARLIAQNNVPPAPAVPAYAAASSLFPAAILVEADSHAVV